MLPWNNRTQNVNAAVAFASYRPLSPHGPSTRHYDSLGRKSNAKYIIATTNHWFLCSWFDTITNQTHITCTCHAADVCCALAYGYVIPGYVLRTTFFPFFFLRGRSTERWYLGRATHRLLFEFMNFPFYISQKIQNNAIEGSNIWYGYHCTKLGDFSSGNSWKAEPTFLGGFWI
jgi:hypothetical protein